MESAVIVSPTISAKAASERLWDVAVIGAGPAGAVAAYLCAQRGLHTLLVEAKRFPRHKVCGGCLSQRALLALRRCDLISVLDRVDAQPIHQCRLQTRRFEAVVRLPAGAVVDRALFDAALVCKAIQAGVEFLPETGAEVKEPDDCQRMLRLKHAGESSLLGARIIIAADGLLRSSLRCVDSLTVASRPGSRIGVGAMIDNAETNVSPGTVTMAIARQGYVGQVQLDHQRVLMAAAVDPQAVAQCVDIASAVEEILLECGADVPRHLHDGAWLGTPPLTRQPALVSAERLFVIGDAAGYVEPFTGEGMAIAIESALAVLPIAAAAAMDGWRPATVRNWQAWHSSRVRRRQWICRSLAWTLRRTWATRVMLGAVRSAPLLSAAILAHMNHSGEGTRQLRQSLDLLVKRLGSTSDGTDGTIE